MKEPARRPRQRKRRTTDAQVDRALDEHFKLDESKVYSLYDLILKMQRNVSPKVDESKLAQGFLKDAVLKLPNFLTVAKPAEYKGPTKHGKLIFGKEALLVLFEKMRARMEAELQGVKLAGLEVFQGYRWLLGCEEQKVVLGEWVGQVLQINTKDKKRAADSDLFEQWDTSIAENSSSGVASSSSAAVSSSAPPSKIQTKGSGMKKVDTSSAHIMKFFKK